MNANSLTPSALVTPNVLLTIAVPDFTGGPRMGMSFALALAQSGFHVTVVVGPRPSANAPSIIEPLRAAGIKVMEETGFTRLLDLALIRRLARLISQERIDCVVGIQQMDSKICSWAAWLAGVPCVFSGQNMVGFWGNRLLSAVKWWGYRVTLAATRPTVACSSSLVAEQYRDEFHLPAEQVRLVENGVDVGQYMHVAADARSRVRQEWNIADDELVMINVGRLHPQKGQDCLLEALAAAQLDDCRFRLLLVGMATEDLPEYGHLLAQLAARHGLSDKVIFAGWRNNVAEFLHAADVCVHPARFEGLSLAVCEAMAAGLPVLAPNDIPIPAGFVHGQHGYVTEGRQIASLATALQRIVTQPIADLRCMGQAAQELVKSKYTLALCVERFVAVVREVIAQHQKPALQPALASLPAFTQELPAEQPMSACSK